MNGKNTIAKNVLTSEKDMMMMSVEERLKEKSEKIKVRQVELKKLEGTVRQMKSEISELEKDMKRLEEERMRRDEEVKMEMEVRQEIEKRVREEMAIRRKVDEEFERMKKEGEKEKEKKVKCDICNVWICNIYAYQTHLMSNKHKYRLKGGECDETVEETPAESIATTSSTATSSPTSSPPMDDKKKKKCDVCDKWLCDSQSYEKHLESTKHRLNVDMNPKRRPIPKTIRIAVWNREFGDEVAKANCKVCDREIKVTDFETGHIIASSKGGSDNMENLLPVCSMCNKSMGTENMNDFRKTYFTPAMKTKTD